jgi:2,4-dienoyl-CoA reductase (NADPH2)
VKLHLNHTVRADEFVAGDYDEIVIATGVTARRPPIDGIDRPNVHSYPDVITGRAVIGSRVAVIGAGGIGFDVTEFLTHAGTPGVAQERDDWMHEWGVADPAHYPGGLSVAAPRPPRRQVYLLQRKTSRIGAGLGKTSGWVHRAAVKAKGVEMINGVRYDRVDDDGLHISVGPRHGSRRVLAVDDVVICAGQESRRDLAAAVGDAVAGTGAGGPRVHLVGGADVAVELDAKRAIDQGTRLAATF